MKIATDGSYCRIINMCSYCTLDAGGYHEARCPVERQVNDIFSKGSCPDFHGGLQGLMGGTDP